MDPRCALRGRRPLRLSIHSFARVEARDPICIIIETRPLLVVDGGHSIVAGRLAGAFRRIGRAEAAGEIVATMKAAGYDVRETDPFAGRAALAPAPVAVAPIVGRMQAMWELMRGKVLEVFPGPPGLPVGKDAYLKFVEDNYRSDAYHSLSIEGYSVSPELIERVRAGNWDTDKHDADRQSRDALAARGYW